MKPDSHQENIIKPEELSSEERRALIGQTMRELAKILNNQDR